MNHQVLARKWRPRSLSELIGQEHIVRMLGNALTQNRVHHAYLFSGTRGVGKTTLARILAKNLNCEMGPIATACGVCKICTTIDANQFLDLYEIDAASRTKVEDTRELLENIFYPPTSGRYKIYLIDEVHMLSNHSFNALLKTLEEPPLHVKFLLATTEPKKLPITILSRCLQFHLKRIPANLIAKHLAHICHSENVVFTEEALATLAHAADGSMRDALSLLDQAINYGEKTLAVDDINAMLGNVAKEDLTALISAFIARDANQVFKALEQLAARGPDYQQILESVATLLHAAALAQLVPARPAKEPLALALAEHFTAEEIQLYYQIMLLGRRELPFAPTPELGFEMTLLRMLAFQPEMAPRSLQTFPAREGEALHSNTANAVTKTPPALAVVMTTASTSPPLTSAAQSAAIASSVAHAPQASVTTSAHRAREAAAALHPAREAAALHPAAEAAAAAVLHPAAEAPAALHSATEAAAALHSATEAAAALHSATEAAAALQWPELLPKLELSGMAYALATNCILTHLQADKIELTLSIKHQPMLNAKLKERLAQAINRYFKKNLVLDICFTKEEILTPLKERQQKEQGMVKAATEKMLNNPQIKRFIDLYDATLEVSINDIP